ncbi:cysteine protease, putative [Plasmodium knowlesi strain H]|uniref:Cysteine protease, putative n=3 Tax=Plasmodium knowlesi TaxID=5850 RepID=A0A1A7VSU3_PLAKH|nr:cysteine protease, putative [Plasmodium knowlesi strain H]OTN66759.1 putative Cysteine protease [Plasmodium knowlesi]CAA9986772.1 cysteine protease, putative [Plasmodium knowlesi strain H]SBO23604.1 cysteine protease, putative [Plasmodium knowlesi strain H]SBO25164.1 cysteine protease, putative [Plasmodium knowlesi strain H]VVS76246.1 cysteine protease, putative [Plasmodium knowlesi strain H]
MKLRICALLLIGLAFASGGARCAPGESDSSSESHSAGQSGGSSAGPSQGDSTSSSQNAAASPSQGGPASPPTDNPESSVGDNPASLSQGTGNGEVSSADSTSGTPGAEGDNAATVQSPEVTNTEVSPQPEANSPDTPPVSQPSSVPTSSSGDSPVPATSSASFTNPIQVKASLLKNYKGVKVTGPCGSYFQVYLVPYLYMNVNSSNSEIEMEPLFMKVDNKIKFEKEKHLLHNICANNKTFKLVLYVYEGVLTIKWKVYPAEGGEGSDKKVDIRKYKMKDIGQPITSIQVMMVTERDGTIYVESKNFSIMNDIPEKCDAIANQCFMSGVLDIQKCYHCTLLLQEKEKAEECFKFVSTEVKNRFEEIQTKGEDEKNPNEAELEETIDNIFTKIYGGEENLHKEVNQLAILDYSLKYELLKYCLLMKEVDASGTLDNQELPNPEDVFAHITTLLQNNNELNVFSLKNKMKNPALCLKEVDQWIGSKTGLTLPALEHSTVQNNEETFDESEDDISGSTTTEGADLYPLHFSDKLFCNYDYCDRTKDTSSCLSKMEVHDQGNCATSWLFASKLHLETIKCMKGYKHIPSSALYVANCSNKETHNKDKCHTPSNPLEFLHTLEETKFLPAESDLPYCYKKVGNDICPEPKSHWQNLWTNIKLVDAQYQPNSISTKGYTEYQSKYFKGNMDAFIKLVKSEIMNKGSVIAYVKATGALSFDLNGKKVQNLCGEEGTPDLAVNIIGYGNYINEEGIKKSYWLLQNSWGYYWGNEGTFKVDMHGPDDCEHNFIHTAAVFNLDIPVVIPAPNGDPEINSYYLKNSPDFYKNLYYNALDGECGSTPCHSVEGQDTTVEQTTGQEASREDTEEKATEQVGASGAGVATVATTGTGAAPGTGAKAGAEAGAGAETEATKATELQEPKLQQEQEQQTQSPQQPPQQGLTNENAQQADGEVVQGAPGQAVATHPVPSGEGNGTGGETVPGNTNSVQSTPQNSGSSAEIGQTNASTNGAEPPVSDPVETPSPVELSKLTGTTGINVDGVTRVLHFLKNVKNGKVTSSFVTYDNESAIGDKSCSRVQSSDLDKLDDCVKFCEENWDACKGSVSPGYCLTKKRGNNECFFCFV